MKWASSDPFEFSSAGTKIGVWINSAGLNKIGRPNSNNIIRSAHEKISVWMGPKMYGNC